jgi:hypothetical protein
LIVKEKSLPSHCGLTTTFIYLCGYLFSTDLLLYGVLGVKMPEENKNEVTATIITIVIVAVIAGIILYTNYLDGKELDAIGRELCQSKGLMFWYSSGSTIRCYKQDNATGIKNGYEFWVDKEIAKKIYIGG